jgi:hypothetical protein
MSAADKAGNTSQPFSHDDLGPAGRRIPADPEAMLYPAEAAYLAALSHRTLETLRVRGGGPPFCRIGTRAVRYRRGALLAWCADRQRDSTSA